MRLIASLVCAIESTRSLRCVGQERVARLELVELLDRHHVDRAEPLDLAAQRGDRLLGAQRPLRGGFSRQRAGRRSRRQRPTPGRRRRRSSSASSAPIDARRPGSRARRARAARTSTSDLVERRAARRPRRCAPGATGRLRPSRGRRRARTRSARIASSAPRASLIAASSSSALRAQRRHRLVGVAHRRRAARRARGRRRRAALRRRRSPRAAPRRGAASRRSSAGERDRALFELGAGFLEPQRLRAPAPPARSTSAACAAPRLGRAAAQLLGRLARLEQPALRDGQPLVGQRAAPPRAARSTRAPPPAGARARRAPPRPGAARARAARPSAPAASSSSVACCSCASWPTIAFSCLWCSAFSAAIAFDACAIVASSSAVSSREPRQRLAVGVDALAQLLDLALGLEDAARLLAARRRDDQVRPAEHVAVARRDRRPARRGSRLGAARTSRAIQASPMRAG